MYRMHSSSTGSGVANMYSYSTGSLGRLDGRGAMLPDDEDVLQEVDEVAVTHPCRVSTISTVPRSFTTDRCNRGQSSKSPRRCSAPRRWRVASENVLLRMFVLFGLFVCILMTHCVLRMPAKSPWDLV